MEERRNVEIMGLLNANITETVLAGNSDAVLMQWKNDHNLETTINRIIFKQYDLFSTYKMYY